MAQSPSHMAFTCLNPECQKKIRINIPAKSGVYSVKCPHCGIVKKLRLKGLDVLGNAQDQIPPEENSQRASITLNQDFFVGTSYEIVCPHCSNAKIPVRSDKAGQGIIRCPNCKGRTVLKIKNCPATSTPAPIDLGDDFYVNQSYTVVCPHCKKAEIAILPESSDTSLTLCPACKGRVIYTARKPTVVIVKSELIQRFRGKLILLRKGWINKAFKLNDGKNIVGRYDESRVSDIAVKGDMSMSRQSIEIYVDHNDKGYSFKLTVKHSANPVLHNNKPLAIGDSISLNFGDSIILGKTKFRFDKDV